MRKFKGLVAATFTPMHADGSLALERVPELVEFALRSQIAGLFAVGSTGEFASLTGDERLAVAEAFLTAAAGRIPVIVNVASGSVEESCQFARHAVEHGADAVCTMTPFYFRPANARELAECVKKVAAASGGLPVYYYHLPVVTHVHVPMTEFLEIMLEECENFAGIKFTDENLYEFQKCMDRSDHTQMMYGRDEMLLASLAVGATAAVGSTFNFCPRLYQALWQAWEAGDLAKARELQAVSHRMIDLIPKYGAGSQKLYMKYAGYDVGPRRLPVLPLSPETETAFRQEITAAGLDPWLG